MTIEYLNGIKSYGKGYEYYGDGKIMFKGEIIKGVKNLKRKEYYENVTIKFEGECLNGEKSGKIKAKEYYGDGTIVFEGEYLKGK